MLHYEVKSLCAFTKYTTQKLVAKPQSMWKKLILTQFSSFDIKC